MIGSGSSPPRRHVYDPLAVKDGRRIGTRDHIREIERQYPNKLTVKTHAFVTQVLFESEKSADGLYKVIGGNILKANVPEPLKPVTMQLLSIRFTSSEKLSSLAVRLTPQLQALWHREEELNQFGIPFNLPGVTICRIAMRWELSAR